MRMLPAALVPALVLALVLPLVLSGCAPHGTTVMPVPEPTSTPVFGSDEDALAAAKVALAAYNAVSDAIAQDGGANPERMASVATPKWLAVEIKSAGEFHDRGKKLVGSTLITNVELEEATDAGSVSVYVCLDFTASSYVDASGQPASRNGPERGTLEVTFVTAGPGRLLLSDSQLWTGASAC